MSSYVQIMGCDGTALYQTENGNMQFRTSGRLEVMIAYDGMVMLKLNDFQFQINSQQEIVCDKSDPQFQMVLYIRKKPTGKWILKINEHTDQVYSCLNEKCYIREKQQKKNYYAIEKTSQIQKNKEKKQQKVKTKKQVNQKRRSYQSREHQKRSQKEDEQQQDLEIAKKPLTAKSIIVGASKGIGLGLVLTGKLLSKGFQGVGHLASKAVKPATDKVQVSQNAKANIEFAKKTSKNILSFTATQVGALFKFGKQTVSTVGERFEKSQKGKQLQANPKYQTVKEGTKTGVQVISNIYDGVVTAVYEMGSGISKGTSKVVGKKYGDEAGQAADDLFQGVGNVVKITRIPQDQAAKALK